MSAHESVVHPAAMWHGGTWLYCPTCADDRPAEQSPGVDDDVEHGEWICMECATVLIGAWLEIDARPRDHDALASTA